MKRAAKNRLTAKSGIITLYLNGETFAVPMDETERLKQLGRHCVLVGEDRFAEKLKEWIEDLSRPYPTPAMIRTNPSLLSQDPVYTEVDDLYYGLLSGTISGEDYDSAMTINDHRRKKLEQIFKRI
jgi:hypothetical protein